MSTHAFIGQWNQDGTIKAIYTHWDGYPEHHGVILNQFYMDPKKVQELINLGDLSVLAEEIGTKCDFSNAPRGQCVAYGRDRGLKDTNAREYYSQQGFLAGAENAWAEYAYLFDGTTWTIHRI